MYFVDTKAAAVVIGKELQRRCEQRNDFNLSVSVSWVSAPKIKTEKDLHTFFSSRKTIYRGKRLKMNGGD